MHGVRKSLCDNCYLRGKNVAQVEENIAASELALSREDMEILNGKA